MPYRYAGNNPDYKPAAPTSVGMSDLLASVVNEVEVLDKEIELMQLRVSECTDSATEQTLRNFGSCLWRHKKALEEAIAANDQAHPTAAGGTGGAQKGQSK